MPAGLDVGSSRIVAATGDRTDSTRNAALGVADSDYVHDFLEGEDTPSLTVEDTVYALGDAAVEVATIVNDEPTRLLGGDTALPPAVAADAMEALLRSLIGEGSGALRYAPASQHDAEAIQDAAGALGYDAAAIDPGLAVVYDAVESPATGVGVVVDGDRTLATLVLEGVPVSRTELSRGGDWIDRELADATGNDPEAVAELRANASLDDPTSGALALRYDTLLSNLGLAMADDLPAVEREVPIVVAGAAAPAGIDSRLADALEDVELPFELGGISRAEDPEHAAARGALVAAREGSDVTTDGEHAAAGVVGYASGLADEAAVPAALAAGQEATTAEAAAAAGAGGAADAPGDEPPGVITPGGAGSAGADGDSTPGHPGPAGTSPGGADGPSAAGSELADLRERLERVEQRLGIGDETPLDEAVATLGEEVAELAAIGADLDALEAQVDDTAEDVTPESIESLRSELEATEERLGDRLDDLEDRLEAFPDPDRVQSLRDRLEALPPVADLIDLAERVEAVDPERIETAGQLEDDLAALGEDIEAVEGNVDAVEGNVDAIDDALGSLETEVAALETDVEAIEQATPDATALEGLRERIDVIETGLEDVEAELESGAVGDADAAAVEDLESLEEGLEDLSEEVEAVRSEVADLQEPSEAVEAVRSDVDAMEGEVDRLDDAVDDLETELHSAEDRVADLEGEVPDPDLVDALSVDLEALRGRVEELEASVTDHVERLEDDVAAIDRDDEAVADLEDDVAELQTDVTGLETDVDDAATAREEIAADLDALGGDLEDLQAELAELDSSLEGLGQDPVERTQHQNTITRVESRIDALEDEVSDVATDARTGPNRPAILVLALGLVALGGVGAGLAYLSEQVALAGAFVAVPVLAGALAWYLS